MPNKNKKKSVRFVSDEDFINPADFKKVIGVLVDSVKKAHDNSIDLEDRAGNSFGNIDKYFETIEKNIEGELEKIASKFKEIDGKDEPLSEDQIRAIAQEEMPEPVDLSALEKRIEDLGATIPKPLSQMTAEEVAALLESLPEGKKLDMDAIEKLNETIADLRKLISKRSGGGVTLFGGSRGVDVYVNGQDLGLAQYVNFVPGTNMDIEFNRIGERLDVIFNASGSGGGGSLTVIPTSSGTVDDSNVSFTFATAPTLVIVNGETYRNGHGCAISGTSVTLDNPVGTGGDIYGMA